MNKSSNILVTGGAGYIGSHCLLSLINRNFSNLICLDNLSAGYKKIIPKEVLFIQADLSDKKQINDIFLQHDIDTVIHFAASISVPESIINPIKYYNNNTINTVNLLEACVQHKIKTFLFSSTAAVYGEVDQEYVNLNTPTNPINPYGISKLLSENIIRSVCKTHGIKYAILRYFNVAGADIHGRSGQLNPLSKNLIDTLVRVILGEQDIIKIFGSNYATPDGTCIRDFIHVSDLADIHVEMINYLQSNDNGVFNCGNGRGYSVKEIVNFAIKKYNIEDKVVYSSPRTGDPSRVVLDKNDCIFLKTKNYDIFQMLESALCWKKKF